MGNGAPPDPPVDEEAMVLSPEYSDPANRSEIELSQEAAWWAEREQFSSRYPGVTFPVRLMRCPKTYHDDNIDKSPDRGWRRCGRPYQHAGPCGPDRRSRGRS